MMVYIIAMIHILRDNMKTDISYEDHYEYSK